MNDLNEWDDYARVVMIFLNLFTLGLLVERFYVNNHIWNSKTRDLWYALVMWTMGGIVFLLQDMYLDTSVGPGFVFLIAATAIGLKGTLAQGMLHDSTE